MEFSDVLEALRDQMEDRHIMLSYQWDLQDMVHEVYDLIEGHDINVWMDIEGGISGHSGSITEAMAEGVEGAAVVCCFMTDKYGKSKNCSAELNYANDSGRTIVPCMGQGRTDDGNIFRASGWLGIITAGKLWIDFKSHDRLENRVVQLLNECCARLAQAETPVGKMKFLHEKKKSKKKRSHGAKKKKTQSSAAKSGGEGCIKLPQNERTITIPLLQPLENGDEIEVWGEYEFGQKFNFNVVGEDLDEVLIHFDIRPTENCVVMNYKKNRTWFKPEIRDYKLVRKFERGEYEPDFHFLMKCEPAQLSFVINGEPMSTVFPIQIPLSEGKNVVLRSEGPPGRWKMLKLPAIKENQVSNKDSLAVKANEEIPLENSLQVGDSIGVWGKHEGVRYNFNIKRNEHDHLLHLDIRPSEGTVVVDTCINNHWGTVAAHLREPFFWIIDAEDEFQFKIDFLEEGMKVYINGKDIGIEVPYQFDMASATYILCSAEKGNPWRRIKLPKPVQCLQTFGTYEFAHFSIGDVINLTAVYRTERTVDVNFVASDDETILCHVSFRPSEGQIVVNSRQRGSWEREVRADIPGGLQVGEMYDIFAMVCEKDWKLEFSRDGDNENVLLEMRMPHRIPFNQPGYIKFSDPDDNVWTELNMPDGTSYIREL